MFPFKLITSATLRPGQYARLPSERRHRVTICCPGCEGEYQLARHYRITAAGLINPELLCPLHGCGWKKPAALGGWA